MLSAVYQKVGIKKSWGEKGALKEALSGRDEGMHHRWERRKGRRREEEEEAL